MLLRTGKTPSGAEAARHIRRLVRHIRRHWPTTHITIRGDGHYGRPEVMDFCEACGIDYVLGLPTNAVLRADPVIVTAADNCATIRAEEQYPVLRHYAETRYAAKSWKHQRRVVARIEASTLGMDIRYVVTSLAAPGPEDMYEVNYCARGNADIDQAWRLSRLKVEGNSVVGRKRFSQMRRDRSYRPNAFNGFCIRRNQSDNLTGDGERAAA